MLDNIKSQMRKGMLEYCILIILRNKPAYATEILLQLRNAQLLVVEGTLYPLLTRLKNASVLNYYWEESNQGPPRKYFEITEEGQQLLTDLEVEWNILANVVEQLHQEK